MLSAQVLEQFNLFVFESSSPYPCRICTLPNSRSNQLKTIYSKKKKTGFIIAWLVGFLLGSWLGSPWPPSLAGPLAVCLSNNWVPKVIQKTSQELRIAALRVVGCQGVKVFSLKDVIITSSVTTVIFITITIWVFELSQFVFFSFVQFEFLSLVTIWSFKFCYNFFLSFITVWVLEFSFNLVFCLFVLSQSHFV